ncbi:MAG: hypothetical protein A4E73_01692 [Syntrophaceae bacterium PtaU1.Bin231]|nr:MAG: hypothetical protein A4E73_01692 [Syntrophaceae bacterium PtaU1.Bin231]
MDHIRVHEAREPEENRQTDPKVYLRAAWVTLVCLGVVASLAWFLFVPPAILPADKKPSSINGTFMVTMPDGEKVKIHIQKVSD